MEEDDNIKMARDAGVLDDDGDVSSKGKFVLALAYSFMRAPPSSSGTRRPLVDAIDCAVRFSEEYPDVLRTWEKWCAVHHLSLASGKAKKKAVELFDNQ